MMEIELQKVLDSNEGPLPLTFSCSVEPGEKLAIYGPSGAGKTSILRMISGLMKPDSGHVIVNGITWQDASTSFKPQERSIGYVFQDNLLFPNMTARQNLEYALVHKDPKRIDDLLEMLGMSSLQHEKPNHLSGGQQQRIALARAILRKPDILLLDEPFSALDHTTRSTMHGFLNEFIRDTNTSVFLVSHDAGEVFKLCDRVFQLDKGRIIKEGKPLDVFTTSKVSGKFQFTGEVIDIAKEDVIYIVSVLIGSNITKVVADETEIEELNVGDKVLVASKAFNPLIQKIES